VTELRFTGDLPLWLVVCIALVLSTVAFLLYRRELRAGMWGWLLPGIRSVAVFLIVMMLAGPELVHSTGREDRGRVVLLIDRSASMGVPDPQMPEADREKLIKALDLDPEAFDDLSRYQRASRIVLDLDNGLLAALRGKHAIDIVELHGDNADLLWSSSDQQTPPDELTGNTESTSTDLGGYLSRSMDDMEDTGGGQMAFVLLTDGRHNQGDPLSQVAVRARAAGVAVHSVAVGSSAAPRDLSVTGIDHPPSIFPDDRVAGDVELFDAMPPGQPFTVEILSGDEVLWSSRQVTVGGGVVRKVAFDFPAEKAVSLAESDSPEGLTQNQLPLAMRARVVGLAEDLEDRNNQHAFQVRAVTGKRKMLILAGRARWDLRYIDTLFTRDPRWEVTSLMGGPAAGRVWERADEGEAFPKTRDALMAYDVVVLGELPGDTLNETELGWLYDFVAKRAGGLIALDGRRGHFLDYAQTPIAPLFPERLKTTTPRPRQLMLTAEGEVDKTLRLEDEQDANNKTWQSLPEPSFIAPIKPRVGIDRVLVQAVIGGTDEEPIPAVLTRRVGAGWVWYSAIDESWRWRRDVESRYQNRYWHQVTNRVVEPLYTSEDKFVSLGVDDAVVDSGGEIPVRVRLRDSDGKPRNEANAKVYLETEDGQRVARAPLSPDAIEGGRFTAKLDANVAPGVYRVGVEVDGVSQSDLLATTLVTVRGTDMASGELADVRLNRDMLESLAQTTDGRVFAEYETSELPELLKNLSSSDIKQNVTALWQSWPWFATVVGLLGVELFLRRRLGML
jgi:hypothetical protein